MRQESGLFSSFFLLLWAGSLLTAVVSGLAHLPFATRYGLISGWRASPTMTHYWAAVALLLLGTYAGIVWLAMGRRRYALTRWGAVRVALLLVLAVTGIFLILHNLPGFSVFGGLYAVVKLSHLFCALILLVLLLVDCCLRLFGRGQWLRARQTGRRRRELV